MSAGIAEEPGGSSIRNLEKWQQGINTGTFQRFDYGLKGNWQHYGQAKPPPYELTTMTMPPTALFSGSHDYLADPKDVARMVTELLPNTVVYQEEISRYGHMDFIWGRKAFVDIYETATKLLKDYAP